jgi:signal peptidase II
MQWQKFPAIFTKPMMLSRKARLFWPVLATVLLTDCATKSVAEQYLAPAHTPHPVVGDYLRFTLAYNPGAAMSLGADYLPRLLLAFISTVAVVGLCLWYRRLRPESTSMALALALVTAGAAGNLWDRLRSPRGVVDFIDVGFSDARFWIFNLADVAITLGALLLAYLLSRVDAERAQA